MKKIQERYKNDKQRQSEEMMKLYKETGTNPPPRAFPILAQSPFFFALYHVLNGIATGSTIGVIDEPLLARRAQRAHIFRCPAGREVHGQRRQGRLARRHADRRPRRHGDHDRPDVGVAVLHAAPAHDEERRHHGEDAVHAAAERC
ncbi:YidC/Oxa1 family membrane protein insertase [Streptomyces sp. KL116D]|uniref:YidC/Oxa1 family membrane protein insertase n=1 Tax=Streptomyces sp. KL116D TaxID=3045152 RepID=UPI003556CBE8